MAALSSGLLYVELVRKRARPRARAAGGESGLRARRKAPLYVQG